MGNVNLWMDAIVKCDASGCGVSYVKWMSRLCCITEKCYCGHICVEGSVCLIILKSDALHEWWGWIFNEDCNLFKTIIINLYCVELHVKVTLPILSGKDKDSLVYVLLVTIWKQITLI